MSAPDTNTERQARRHKPALVGIVVALVIAAAAAIVMVAFVNIPATEQATPVRETAPEIPPVVYEDTETGGTQ